LKTPPKYHHHIPTFLIRNWAGQDEKVWSLNKYENIVQPKLPETIMGEKFANRFVDLQGKKDTSVESRFSEAETAFSDYVRSLLAQVNSKSLPSTGSSLVNKIHRFFWSMIVRAPSMRFRHSVTDKFYEKEIAARIVEYEARGIRFSLDTSKLLSASLEKDNLKRQLNVIAVGEASLLPPQDVYQTGIAILKTRKTEKTFILGLNPICKLSVRSRTPPLAALPVSPNVAIAPFGPKNSFSTFEVNDSDLRAFNLTVWKNSTEVVSNSIELLNSVSNQR
jgi:Protein of unknown function (DUF4238)